MKFSDRTIMNLVMLVFLVFILAMTGQYNPRAQLIPLVVAIPVTVMVFLQFLFDAFPGARKYLGFLKETGIFSQENFQIEGQAGESSVEVTEAVAETAPPQESWGQALRVFIWLAAFTLAMIYIPYLITIPLFVFLMVKVEAGESWVRSLGMALGTGLFVYLLFVLLLRSNF